jgi:hypothetical protein
LQPKAYAIPLQHSARNLHQPQTTYTFRTRRPLAQANAHHACGHHGCSTAAADRWCHSK